MGVADPAVSAGCSVPVWLVIFFFLFSLSGVPGKKCGTIILSAEELSNCRVSSRSHFSNTQDHPSLEEPEVDRAPGDLAGIRQ